MIRTLTITYATWSTVASANMWPVYHVPAGSGAVTAVTGNNRLLYRADIGADDYSAWQAAFANSTEVSGEDEAVALIVGLYDVPADTRTRDGRRVTVEFPAREGWNTWFHSAGDASATPAGRGKSSDRLTVSWAFGEDGPSGSAKTKTASITVSEPTWVHDGQAICYPPVNHPHINSSWRPTDRLSFYIKIPASTVDQTGTLDVIPVDTGILAGGAPSGESVYIPDGHPVLALLGDPAMTHRMITKSPVLRIVERDGFWLLDEDTGEITPAVGGEAGNCHLMDIDHYGAQMIDVWLGQGDGVLDIDVAKSEYFHPAWTAYLSVTKDSKAQGVLDPVAVCSVWILSYRRSSEIDPTTW